MQACKFSLVFSIIVLLSPGTLTAQSSVSGTIKGTVIDAETGSEIEGVNVYLANTSIGTSTNKNGTYKLTSSTQGEYNLVFSIIGYHRKIYTVNLNWGSNFRLNVQLEPQIIEMEEVEVISSNKDWREDYDFFLKEFLGETEFAKLTTIKNPWILDFSDGEHNKLIATAVKPLIIENRALGYTMHVELIEFIWNRRHDEGVYKIYPRYEELDTDSDLQMRKWLINRQKTYYGSLVHFLRSLYSNRLKQEHFSVQRIRNIEPLSKGEKKFELLGHPGINNYTIQHLKGFKLRQTTDVSFLNTAKLKFGDRTFNIPIKKNSKLASNTDNNMFFIYESGALLNPISIKLYGDWAENRVANSLPHNYYPAN